LNDRYSSSQELTRILKVSIENLVVSLWQRKKKKITIILEECDIQTGRGTE